MSSGGDKELTAWKDRHTTGKSIEIDRRSCAQGLFEVSALAVVVNELDGEVKAHHGDECSPG